MAGLLTEPAIAPDGRIAAAARDDTETIVVADLDLSLATRAEAQARARHPVLDPFWEAGVKLHSDQAVEAPSLKPLKSAETDITLAAAQAIGDVSDLEPMIGQAQARAADVVVFPERAAAENTLEQLQLAARRHRITVVIGMEHRRDGDRRNSAFVIGPDGSVLTRYDQLSAASPFQLGDNPSAMWFRVKGVPAVVTIGRDALWTELAELAAVAGAQVHIHLDHDPANDHDAALRRLQVWSNTASFQTVTATVNVVGSAIWDDLRDADERRAEVRDLPRPDTGFVEVYSPFSANLVVRAGETQQLITATLGRVATALELLRIFPFAPSSSRNPRHNRQSGHQEDPALSQILVTGRDASPRLEAIGGAPVASFKATDDAVRGGEDHRRLFEH